MKKALIFSFFLSIFTFYSFQKYSGEFKAKLGINELQLMAGETNVLDQNKMILSVNKSTPEPVIKCIKYEGRLYCKSTDKII